MKCSDIEVSISQLQKKLSKLLEASSSQVLEQAKYEARHSYQRYKVELERGDSSPTSWGYTISFDNPLTFKPVQIHGTKYQMDMFCKIRWMDPGEPPCEQNTVIRVWAQDPQVYYRQGLDDESILQRLDARKGRVMLRYHFDRANRGQQGPIFHLQAGGNSRDEEVCWLHEAVSIPRVPHPPLDLILACEMIVSNFFLNNVQVLDDPQVAAAIKKSQIALLLQYYEKCVASIRQDRLLKCLSV